MSDPEPSHAHITVGIVSRNHLVRVGLQAALATQSHMRFVGAAASELEAETLVPRAHPHVLVIEMEPDIDIRELVGIIKTSVPTTRIIVLSGIEDHTCSVGSVSSGIDGIVLTIQPPVVLLATINHVCRLPAAMTMYERTTDSRVAQGEAPVDEAPPQYFSTKPPDTSLTVREREIIQLVGQALSNRDIAERLCISSITVRHHLANIFGKFEVNNRQQLLLRAYEHGLLKPRAYL
ncbi:MAG: response regulator transcription factor [Nitrospira sp.]